MKILTVNETDTILGITVYPMTPQDVGMAVIFEDGAMILKGWLKSDKAEVYVLESYPFKYVKTTPVESKHYIFGYKHYIVGKYPKGYIKKILK